ncbi:MAG: extracellular solute-binding protein [Halobacteriaceae archaeon]
MSPSDESSGNRTYTRRNILETSALAGLGSLAGCTSLYSDQTGAQISLSDFRGSGPLVSGRQPPGGVSMEEMPDLSGTLTLYLGGGERGLYVRLFDLLREKYPEFTLLTNTGPSTRLAQTIIQEYQSNALQGDVFLPVDAGALGVVAAAGATQKLPDSILTKVPRKFRGDNGQWTGLEGRVRSIPYNTNKFDESDIPNDIFAFPDTSALKGTMGWAPTYGAFQAFITAMRILNGPSKTKEWLREMMNYGVQRYGNEYFVASAVADGAIGAGFANHYYALRVQNARPDAPLKLAFTTDDAGSLVNVSGACVLAGTQQESLAQNFIRHLLSSEAQEFFATVTKGYPLIKGVAPLGNLPTIRQLNPPEFDLTKLKNLQKTIDLMREVGVL